ncbi:MAG: dihydropteroate synthase, partial [Acetobacter sp.]|nr:dihydropteroate synthase [Acetobacter sp.]
MFYERLIEPTGLLHGNSAIAAIKAGLAYPLQGGPTAFSLAFLI